MLLRILFTVVIGWNKIPRQTRVLCFVSFAPCAGTWIRDWQRNKPRRRLTGLWSWSRSLVNSSQVWYKQKHKYKRSHLSLTVEHCSNTVCEHTRLAGSLIKHWFKASLSNLTLNKKVRKLCSHGDAWRCQKYLDHCREIFSETRTGSVDILDWSVSVKANFCNYKGNNIGVIYQSFKIINSSAWEDFKLQWF